MDLFQEILELDAAYLETFSTRIQRSWGSLFFNEQQANYYDANHAHISEACENPQRIIDEVVSFYKSRGIVPRFYIYNLELQQELIRTLTVNLFQQEELISPVQLWNRQLSDMSLGAGNTIETVTHANVQDALDIECGIKEFGGREVVEKTFMTQFNHPSFTHYLLRRDGIPASTACLMRHHDQARIESVATREAYRGKGLVGELIRFIQKEAMDRGHQKLWVFPINETVEKIYQKYGFQTIDRLRTVHAFTSGRSIREIHGNESK
ncbi:GNAT family N-acetyltransferase [Paenibacillus dokdonensis]|uniref:GNAT family N-acetyltransferase n=1 Tax=Paenibacillus dokdonensis TaxID=2567944 RepID=A0ABU6GSW9_9BACL|nr:GNAT family N-acetyltransferase [Paenibacillus dokdonensis]MEC0242318.1 GNAT family N-acetyltransferase [Paenibacillus dokdonensis]